MTALNISGLTIEFGGLTAVGDLNLQVEEKSIFGLIGPNGAGKTTVFNLLTGVYQPTRGSVAFFSHRPATGLKPFQITRLGVARTFQNIRLFRDLSVLDNLRIASDCNTSLHTTGLVKSILRTKEFAIDEDRRTAECLKLLKIFNLDGRAEEDAKNLPYGDQRRLEIVRAMATGARLLLLDEPAAGLNPNETEELMNCIRMIRDRFGITIVLIEHDMRMVMGICERIAVLDYGIKIAEGSPKEVQANSKVIEAYLGKASTDV